MPCLPHYIPRCTPYRNSLDRARSCNLAITRTPTVGPGIVTFAVASIPPPQSLTAMPTPLHFNHFPPFYLLTNGVVPAGIVFHRYTNLIYASATQEPHCITVHDGVCMKGCSIELCSIELLATCLAAKLPSCSCYQFLHCLCNNCLVLRQTHSFSTSYQIRAGHE